MSDPAAQTQTHSAKGSKKSKSDSKKKSVPNHPPISEMVGAAIAKLNERGGSSAQAIKKYIAGNYKVDVERLAPFIKKYLKSGVTSGTLVQTKGKGASGSFKLKSKEKPKVAKKPKAPKSPKPKSDKVKAKKIVKKKPKTEKTEKPKKAPKEKKASPKKASKPKPVVEKKSKVEKKNKAPKSTKPKSPKKKAAAKPKKAATKKASPKK